MTLTKADLEKLRAAHLAADVAFKASKPHDLESDIEDRRLLRDATKAMLAYEDAIAAYLKQEEQS